MHIRDIHGVVIKTLTKAPTEYISIPSLGVAADRYADSVGHVTSVILLLHHTYLQSSLLAGMAAQQSFINEMTSRGMPLVEVEFYWDMIHLSYSGGSLEYRQRFCFGVE